MGNATLTLLPASPVQTPATPEQYNDLVNAITGNQVMRDPTTGIESDGTYDIGDVSNGRPKDVNITGDIIKNGQVIGVSVPIGAVFPWFKSMSGVPALPSNYHECDGSVITEALSPMYGQTLPNINSAGRFVRGGTTSGTIQTNQNKSHHHGLTGAATTPHTHPSVYVTGASHMHNPGTLVTDTAADHVHSVADTANNDTTVASGAGATQILHTLTTRNTGAAGAHAHYVTGGTTAASGTLNMSGDSGLPSTYGLSGNTDMSTAGTPDESRPDCITAVYVMRIY
jgi:hypothetical protein